MRLRRPKLKKPKKITAITKRLKKRGLVPDLKAAEAIQDIPRITNETVAEHREDVLSQARKYIYPLNHSRHRIVVVTASLLASAIIAFFAYCFIALYRFQSTSSFIYGVTRVIPFPIAKAGSSFVAYENYLFELRHYMHYYKTQQQVNFSSPSGKVQLAYYKKQAMQQVVDNAYIKQLASQNHISVSSQDIDNEVAIVKSQNRLGSSDQVFQDVLSQFWGWSTDDFNREVGQQLLAQKLVAKLDVITQKRAQAALAQLKSGVDFGTLAQQVSDDVSTKANGGEYGLLIDPSNRNVAPQAVAALFQLKTGQYSGIINVGYSLEIDKVLEIQGNNVRAAHIVFNFRDINIYLNPLKAKNKPSYYLKV